MIAVCQDSSVFLTRELPLSITRAFSKSIVCPSNQAWLAIFEPLMYGKTAKPIWESGGSVHLKNIPTNSSGEGMASEVDLFFTILDIVAYG